MPLHTEQENKIMTILRDLPDEKLNEVIDFAEYLKKKSALVNTMRKKNGPRIPIFHLGRIGPTRFEVS